MADGVELALQQRKAFESQRQRIEETIARTPRITQRELRSKAKPLEQRERIRSIITGKSKLEGAKQALEAKRTQFEMDITSVYPEVALPEYKAKAEGAARDQLANKIDSLYDQRSRLASQGKDTDKISYEIALLEKFRDTASSEDLIKSAGSGGFSQAISQAAKKAAAGAIDPSFYGQEISRFKGMGYSSEEARNLANWSIQNQRTPTPSQAEQIAAQGYTNREKAEAWMGNILEQAKTRTQEISRFEQAGYTKEQATALASYSLTYQKTPSPMEAEEYLRGAGLAAPLIRQGARGILDIPSYVTYQTGMGIRSFGKAVDVKLGEAGIPKEYRSVKLDLELPNIPKTIQERTLVRDMPKTYTFTAGQAVSTAGEVGLWVVSAPAMLGMYGAEYVAEGAKYVYPRVKGGDKGDIGTLGGAFWGYAKERPAQTAMLGAFGLFMGARALKPKFQTKTQIVDEIIPTQMPKIKQYVVYDPKLKKYYTQYLDEAAKVKAAEAGIILQEITTGLERIRYKVTKKPLRKEKIEFLDRTPITIWQTGITSQKEGLFKMLPKRQAAALEKTIVEQMKGRKFYETAVKGKGVTDIKTKGFSFVSATTIKDGQAAARGLAKTYITAGGKRIQRTGKVMAISEKVPDKQLSKEAIEALGIFGKVTGKDVSVQRGITGFKPLYRDEPVQLAKTATIVSGTPTGEIGEVMSIKLVQQAPQITTANLAETLKSIYGTTTKPATQIKFISKTQAGAGAIITRPAPSPKLVDKPVPLEWQGVYDVQEPQMVTGFGESKLGVRSKLITGVVQKQTLKTKQRLSTKQVSALATQILPKTTITTREKSLQKQRTILRTRLATKQLSLLKTQQRAKTITTQIPRTSVTYPPIIPKAKGAPTGTIGELSPYGKKVLIRGFDVFVKRRGKWVKVSTKALPKIKAIQLGTKITEKTLAASFKIEKGKPIKARGLGRGVTLPSSFRSYRIVKGKKVPLKDQWIQKKGARLSSKGEVIEIQQARGKYGFK